MATKTLHTWGFLGSAVLASATLLSGCGGGSSPTATTLSGTAAVGVPIVAGAVTVNCAAGSALTTTTTSTGGWTVTINGQTLPCATRVTGGTVGGVVNATPYHSIAVSFGTVNITPLTDLVVAQLTGANPATWFASPAFTGVNASAVNTAMNAVTTSLGLTATLGEGNNPLTTKFEAKSGVVLDNVLEALKATLADTTVNKSYAQLLAAATARDFSTFSGFQSTFSTIYVNLAPPASSGASSCSTGQTLMIYNGGASNYTNGQGLCFTGSATALTFSGKTLTNVAQNTGVSSPFSAYKFTDASDSYVYEVIFNSGALYEINVSKGSGANDYVGQFAPSTTSGGGIGAGAGTLTVATTVMGLTTTVVVSGVTKPADQSEFCSSMQNDGSITALKAMGTFALTGCTYSGNTATITALVTAAGISIPYSIAYTYS